MEKLVNWIRKHVGRDSSKIKPLLKDNLVTYYSYSDKNQVFLSDVVLREIFIEIEKIGHEILELSDGKTTIDEITSLVYEKYPMRYESRALAQNEILNFLEMLNNKGIITLMNYG